MFIRFVTHRKIWYSLSGILIILSIAALAVWGLNPSIDFVGGSLLEVEFTEAPPESQYFKDVFTELEFTEPVIQPSGQQSMVLRFDPATEADHQNILDKIKEQYADVTEVRFDSIGPVVGQELFRRSIIAIILVTLLVLIYIAWSFRKVSRPVPAWVYGAIVIIAFLHDTIIPLGIFAWLGKFRDIEIGSPFIAAVLMILGYSINDTIVVLDRVRENIKRIKGSFMDIVEASIHQTIVRSVNTSFTTLLVLLAVVIFGGESLQVFAIALIIGVILGTYSSIFIAAPLLITWYRWKGGK